MWLINLLFSIGIYFLPTIVGFVTNRLDVEVIEAIKRKEIKGNNKAMAIVVNFVGFFTLFIPLIPFIAWCAAWYLVFKKTEQEPAYVYASEGPSSQKSPDYHASTTNEAPHQTMNSSDQDDLSVETKVDDSDDVVSEEAQEIAKDVVAKSLNSLSSTQLQSEDGDYEYKSVPAPSALLIKRSSDYDKAIRSYASIIDAEAVDGWDFFLIQKIPITRQAGCLMTLLGKSDTDFFINMLVFRRVK